MKIGIVTFWSCGENYGSQLQCFALQYVLKKLGHTPFLIRQYTRSSWRERLKSPFALFIRLLCRLSLYFRIDTYRYSSEIKQRDFSRFRKDNISVSSLVYSSIRELRSNPPIADAYIVGSDQVWNCFPLTEEGKVWFLDFGPSTIPRISYAASIGIRKNNLESIEFMTPLLAPFSAISVREKIGVDICSNAGRSDVVHVCDPTLLLERNEWDSALKFSKSSFRKGIFIYALNLENKEDIWWSEIEEYANQTKQEINIVPTQGVSRKVLPRKYFYFPRVEEFLASYANASCVFTNSFHGVVFSIIMRKPFLAIMQKGRTAKTNNRIKELLCTLGLTSRIYSGGDISSQMSRDIDWRDVSTRLNLFRSQSLDFLARALLPVG